MSSLTAILNKSPNNGPGGLNAPLKSPTLTGTVTVPTPAVGDNDSSLASTAFVRNAIREIEYSYGHPSVWRGMTTAGAYGVDTIFDAAGNLYIAQTNAYNGSSYSTTSYVYKITPSGVLTTFASIATTFGANTSLAFDASGNLYWSVINHYNGSSYSTTSYVYKITPAGSLSTFASVATSGAQSSKLIFDADGNLYWAVSTVYNGTTYNLTSYVYKITPAGSLSTFASVATSGATSTDLIFDTDGNLYWAIGHYLNGTTYNLTSYVYKITPAGSFSTFASVASIGVQSTVLAFDASGNLYWSIASFYNGTNYSSTSYVYKITPAGSLTTFASKSTTAAQGVDLIFDENGNLYWALGTRNSATGATYKIDSYIYKITPEGKMDVFALIPGPGIINISICQDTLGNFFCSAASHYNDTVWNITSFVYRISKISN